MSASPSLTSDADVEIGTVLDGRYRIDALLGSGGMGRVYRGEHVGIGRAVAIKVLHADLSRNREAAQRFQREALASGRLDHPNIVGVSDFGIVENGPFYLVMEVLEGESLGARLEREKRLPWREAVRIMRGVLEGLHHAHDRGVVHRDIKPDNVFLAKRGNDVVVKILDFGIAKLYAGSPDDPAATRAGLTVGTPAYLSPEQAVGGEIKPASDLYSSTILLFEMLTGRAPFEEKDPLAMLGAHVSKTPPTVAEVAPDVAMPAGLEEVIQRGLIKPQAERINTATEYLSLLDAVERGSQLALPVVAPVHDSRDDPTRPASPVGMSLGIAPTQAHLPTPVPTPFPMGAPTPTPFPVSGAAPTVALLATRPSAAETKQWVKIGAIILGVLLLLGIIAGISRVTSKSSATAPAAPEAHIAPPKVDVKPTPKDERPVEKTVDPVPTPKVEPVAAQPEIDMDGDDDVAADKIALKLALHDLKAGKSCAARKAAISKIVALDDKAAIPALKRARYRMYGGLLGLGQKNANYCLKAAAEAAIKKLGT